MAKSVDIFLPAQNWTKYVEKNGFEILLTKMSSHLNRYFRLNFVIWGFWVLVQNFKKVIHSTYERSRKAPKPY